MSILEHRLSDELIDAPYIPPEQEDRKSFVHDIEGGPVGITDTSFGMNYQVWDLDYIGSDFVLTPRTTGSPSTIISAADVEQASFCFDQNARPSIVYVTSSSCFLYWYDTTQAQFVTTEFPGIKSAMLSLDDKRDMQVGANDIIFWYTKEVSAGVYHLFTREQRDRFLTEYRMEINGVPPEVLPYLWKAGMHQGLRGKIVLSGSAPSGGGIVDIPQGVVIPQANLDFEAGDAYWNKIGDFTITQADPHAGNWSAILTTTALVSSSIENTVYTTVIPNQGAFLSAYVKGTEATNIRIGLKFYNISKVLISASLRDIAVSTNWELKSDTYYVPSNAVYARIYVESNSTTGTVSLDDIVFNPNLYLVELGTTELFEVELDSLVNFEVEV